MGLIGNYSVLNKSHARFTNGTSTAGAYAGITKSNWTDPSKMKSRMVSVPSKDALWTGYGVGQAYVAPIKSGGMGSSTQVKGSGSVSNADLWQVRLSQSAISGLGEISNAALGLIVQGVAAISGTGSISGANLLAVSNMSAALAGSSSISSANLSATVPLEAALSGSGSMSPSLTGTGSLSATIEIGAAVGLTASDVWNFDISSIDTAGTAGDYLKDAGAAGNPWAALIDDNNDPGTFGERVSKLLTVAKFLGLK